MYIFYCDKVLLNDNGVVIIGDKCLIYDAYESEWVECDEGGERV